MSNDSPLMRLLSLDFDSDVNLPTEPLPIDAPIPPITRSIEPELLLNESLLAT